MAKTKYHHGDLKNALIAAGVEILSKEGTAALSLRRVAQRAGVSHSAPYAHFADKQALIAAISTEGYRRLYETLSAVDRRHQGDPLRQLVEGAWAYVGFALHDPAHFKITFSGVVEREKDYPELVEMATQSFELFVRIVEACQSDGILRAGPPDLVAVGVWSLVHGFVWLQLEGQISHTIRDRFSLREMLVAILNQVMCVEFAPAMFAVEGLRTEATG